MSNDECSCLGTGCDITLCDDCGEDYTDPCAYHRSMGHVPSYDPYWDGVECEWCCRKCKAKS